MRITAIALAASMFLACTADASPPPTPSKSKDRYAEVIGWPAERTPTAPPGFTVRAFARDLRNPRWLYRLPNGDVLVAEASTVVSTVKKLAADVTGKSDSMALNESADRITLLRDADEDGIPEVRETFVTGIKQPFGMVLVNNYFYVAGTDRVVRFPYEDGQTKLTGDGEKILDLPAGGYNNHWTRNLIADDSGSKLYISVGSGSNIAENGFENEVRRANILEVNLDGSGERIFASGLRNPVGMAWAPGSKVLWTAVNERDELGDDLVPDYITSVRPGAFYGWPYSYLGSTVDERIPEKDRRPDLVAKAVVPDVLLGSHTASLGLAFYTGAAFPERYRGGAFIAQHGSWNRSELVGYRVAFVPFTNGAPAGKEEDFLTGFIANRDEATVYGRPVGVIEGREGTLLVADDSGNTVWSVAAKRK